jgi:hypothetical protein
MQMPDNVSPEKRYAWGRYPVRALLRAGLTAFADRIRPVNEEIRTIGRSINDLQDPLDDAYCDRDQIDAELDDLTRTIRYQILARVAGNEASEPYASIFPNGITVYTRANLGEQVTAYESLARDLERYLAVDDAIRVEQLPKLRAVLASWVAAQSAVGAAEQELQAAARRLADAVGRWEHTMLTVHVDLMAKYGSRKKADLFFPKARRSKKAAAEPPVPTPAPAPAPPVDASAPATESSPVDGASDPVVSTAAK